MTELARPILKPADVYFHPTSLVDDTGRVFLYRNRVFRAIECEDSATQFTYLLKQDWFIKLFELGLVNTWITDELVIENTALILEHQKIPYYTEPSEWTTQMHWQAAKVMVNLNLKLSHHGYGLKDSHPWNLMYSKGKAVFVDFGSIASSSRVSYGWFQEFRRYFASPIWLANTPLKNLALEYRREHHQGFGINLFNTSFFRKVCLRRLDKLSNYLDNPPTFFEKLMQWLESAEPQSAKTEYWSHYEQSKDDDFLTPSGDKQKFVFNSLKVLNPIKVLDCAANKGYFSAMAASLGASVAAFDYEEHCVDQCLSLATTHDLDITPAIMNFLLPTPNHGLGLVCDDAFERFKSDVVIVMGLIHHVCIRQGMPVKLFCDVCKRYAKEGIILEFVHPDDKHVSSWQENIPRGYSLSNIISTFSDKYSEFNRFDYGKNEVHRTLLCFYKPIHESPSEDVRNDKNQNCLRLI